MVGLIFGAITDKPAGSANRFVTVPRSRKANKINSNALAAFTRQGSLVQSLYRPPFTKT
jgi:hypothetical protein